MTKYFLPNLLTLRLHSLNVTLLLFLLILNLLLSGCLRRERSSPWPVAPSEEAKASWVNAWPFYNGNGEQNKVVWPLLTWGSERFSLFPIYNYDHGIHDFCFLATAVPTEKTYRLFPFVYRSNETLTGTGLENRWFTPYIWWETTTSYDPQTIVYSPLGYYSSLNAKNVHAWRMNLMFNLAGIRRYTQWDTEGADTGNSWGDWSHWIFPIWWSWGEDVNWSQTQKTVLLPFYYSESTKIKEPLEKRTCRYWFLPFSYTKNMDDTDWSFAVLYKVFRIERSAKSLDFTFFWL